MHTYLLLVKYLLKMQWENLTVHLSSCIFHKYPFCLLTASLCTHYSFWFRV